MKRLLYLLIPLVLIAAILTALLIVTLIGKSQIEDTNGADPALCTLTDEDIFSKSTSSSSVGSVSTQINREYSYRVKKLSGVYEAVEFRASGDTLTIQISSTLTQGNLRIVLMCDGEYVQDIPVGQDQTITIPNPDGKYAIRLAAESAELSLECAYDVT